MFSKVLSPKFTQILACIVAILTALAQGSIKAPVGITPEFAAAFVSWDNFLLAIYAVALPFMLFAGDNRPGFLTTTSAANVMAVATKVVVGALVFCLVALHLGPAIAAGESPTQFNAGTASGGAVKPTFTFKKIETPVDLPAGASPAAASGPPCTDLLGLSPIGCVKPNGQPGVALPQWLQDAITFFSSGFPEAAALATQFPDVQDFNGNICWNQAATIGKLLKAHPFPLTLNAPVDLEALRLFNAKVNQLCANPGCGQVFTDLSNGISQMGLGVPNVSITAICAKIPPINLGSAAIAAAFATPATPAPVTPVTPPTPAAPAAQ